MLRGPTALIMRAPPPTHTSMITGWGREPHHTLFQCPSRRSSSGVPTTARALGGRPLNAEQRPAARADRCKLLTVSLSR
jgi:hypothetical protein